MLLQINVFKLGKTFKDFAAKCAIDGFEQVAAENLVHRLAARLEFGRKTEKVATDAIRLVQRMEKDWMTTGRRPSGICGACLILAARMNNFRRTVREVVYVVKVTDMTINKRLDEFKVTPSSELTVEEFRKVDLEARHDPPAFYQQREGKKRKRTRGQTAAAEEEEGAASNAQGASSTDAAAFNATTMGGGLPTPQSSAPSASQPAPLRRDKDGFAIPDVPIDPTLIAASATALSELTSTPGLAGPSDEPPAKRPRGRPRKDSIVQQPIDPADIAIEQELETEISQYLNQPSTMQHAKAYASALEAANAISLARKPDSNVPDDVTINDSEFEDDPEVRDCVLSPEEQAIKERIWVHENRDYLRDQQRKLLKQQMEERTGTVKVKKTRNRKKRIGEADESSTASTPAEAIVNVMKRRGFSKKINYNAIRGMFEGRSSRMGSREPSVSEAGDDFGSITRVPPEAPKPKARKKRGKKADGAMTGQGGNNPGGGDAGEGAVEGDVGAAQGGDAPVDVGPGPAEDEGGDIEDDGDGDDAHNVDDDDVADMGDDDVEVDEALDAIFHDT